MVRLLQNLPPEFAPPAPPDATIDTGVDIIDENAFAFEQWFVEQSGEVQVGSLAQRRARAARA